MQILLYTWAIKKQDVFSHFRIEIIQKFDKRRFFAHSLRSSKAKRFPIFDAYWRFVLLVFCLDFRVFLRYFFENLTWPACNRKFTFYPLPIHKRVVHYLQSKDTDRPPILPPIPSQSKAPTRNVGAFDFWCFQIDGVLAERLCFHHGMPQNRLALLRRGS